MTTDVRAAYRRCEEITWSQARNFSYGIRLLPPAKRQALAAVYAFARRIDDIGDGDLLDQGAPITGTLRGSARAAVAGYVAGGRAALAAITASGCDVLAATPRPRKHRVAAELLRAYLTGR